MRKLLVVSLLVLGACTKPDDRECVCTYTNTASGFSYEKNMGTGYDSRHCKDFEVTLKSGPDESCELR